MFSFYPDTTDGFNGDFGTTNLADNHRKVDIDQYAAFGEVSYMLPDNLKASVGARYYQYHSNSVTSVSGVSANGTSNPLFGLAQNSGVTPKLDLAYIPDDNTTVYGTVSKGFRPGGPNSPIPVPPCASAAPTQFGPDSVWNYELGEKLRFLDSRISVNGAIYYEDWTNVQQEVAPSCGFKFTANAGKATVYGAELEVAVVLMPGFVLSQNGGYTHATNSTTLPAAGVVSGQRLLDVPEVTANTALSFKQPLANDMNFVSRLTNSYVSSIQDITFTRNSLPAYDLVGLPGGGRDRPLVRRVVRGQPHEQDGVAQRHGRPVGEHLNFEPGRHEPTANDRRGFELQVLNALASDYPSRPYAWTVVAILIATAVLSYTDRQVLSLLVDPNPRRHGYQRYSDQPAVGHGVRRHLWDRRDPARASGRPHFAAQPHLRRRIRLESGDDRLRFLA